MLSPTLRRKLANAYFAAVLEPAKLAAVREVLGLVEEPECEPSSCSPEVAAASLRMLRSFPACPRVGASDYPDEELESF